ncbi:MAG TPA: hypothetical protein VNI36_06595 [Candidatus Dormibacteraeota bacterium]|nr:hypothetical protein [Candidatus Dormibacteraeota bacterium]
MRETMLRALTQAYDNLLHMIGEFLPRFIVMVAIIIVGWLVALILKRITRSILRLTNLDRLGEEAGASGVLRKAALPSLTELVSRAVFWLVWLGFILIGISVLEISGMQEQISRIFGLLPQFLVALLILFIGLVAANFFSRAALLGAVNSGYPSPQVFSGAVRFVIWILAISMALEQIGLARETAIAAFSIVFGAVMLGLAIAFGLGGRDLARLTLEKYFGEKKKEKEDEPMPL